MAIVRRGAAGGVSAALLHFADACCAAGVVVPPVLPGGKGPRNFELDRYKQLAGVRQRAEIIQLPSTTPALADRTWVLLTRTPEGGTCLLRARGARVMNGDYTRLHLPVLTATLKGPRLALDTRLKIDLEDYGAIGVSGQQPNPILAQNGRHRRGYQGLKADGRGGSPP